VDAQVSASATTMPVSPLPWCCAVTEHQNSSTLGRAGRIPALSLSVSLSLSPSLPPSLPPSLSVSLSLSVKEEIGHVGVECAASLR
jgi:hypothetical protein